MDIQFKNKKQGFTIVELVIVIAIIGILSAILIPTFAGLISKARLTADQNAVSHMNTALMAEEAVSGKPENYDEASVVLKNAGFNVPSDTVSEGYLYVWDAELNRIFLYNSKTQKVEYPQEVADELADINGFENGRWFSLAGTNDEPVTPPVADKCDVHTFGEDVITPATCQDDGLITRTCKVCGEVETETIEKSEYYHVFAAESIGYYRYFGCDWHTGTCMYCGEVFDEEKIGTNKNYPNGFIFRDDIDEFRCLLCSFEEGSATPKNDYFCSGTCVVCGHEGSETYHNFVNGVCEYCGGKPKCEDDAHIWQDWTQSKAPTCTATGSEKRECSECHISESRSIPALGHDTLLAESTGNFETHKITKCSRCSTTTASQSHDWVVVKLSDTEFKYMCSICHCTYDSTDSEPCMGGGSFNYKYENGQMIQVCSVCGKPHTVTAHHLDANGDCTDDGCDFTINGKTIISMEQHIAGEIAININSNTTKEIMSQQDFIDFLLGEGRYQHAKLMNDIKIDNDTLLTLKVAGVTLDLNGHRLDLGNNTITTYGSASIVIKDTMYVVPTDGTITVNGLMVSTAPLFKIRASATVTIESGVYYRQSGNFVFVTNYGNLNLNGGVFLSDSTSSFADNRLCSDSYGVTVNAENIYRNNSLFGDSNKSGNEVTFNNDKTTNTLTITINN